MDVRLKLIAIGAPAGLLIGALLWLIFGGANAEGRRLETLEAQLGRGPAPSHSLATPTGRLAASLAGKSIFAVDAGASADMAIRLVGVAMTPRGKSALVAFEGGTPEWMVIGDEHKGLTLSRVGSGEVEFDTPFGSRTIGMNNTTPAAGGAARPASQSGAMGHQ